MHKPKFLQLNNQFNIKKIKRLFTSQPAIWKYCLKSMSYTLGLNMGSEKALFSRKSVSN